MAESRPNHHARACASWAATDIPWPKTGSKLQTESPIGSKPAGKRRSLS